MDKFLETISNYNFFNYLFPWALFLIYFNYINPQFLNIEWNNWIILLIVSYYCGLLISKFWSLVIEFLFKKWWIIKFSDYKDLLNAINVDWKLNTLVEQNNMNRTLISLSIISIILTIIFDIMLCRISYIEYILLIISLIIIIFSYRKQTNYINKRIQIVKK